MLMKIITTGWKVFTWWKDILIYWFIRYILNILIPRSKILNGTKVNCTDIGDGLICKDELDAWLKLISYSYTRIDLHNLNPFKLF